MHVHTHLLMTFRAALLPLATVVLLSWGCKKNNATVVPYVPVDININVNLPEYNALASVGGWAYITGGSEGLIVFRKSLDAFTAMDRNCPVQPQDLCKITVENNNILAVDTFCCHCSFLLQDGSLVSNPNSVNGAGIGLKLYNTTFNGTNLHIFN